MCGPVAKRALRPDVPKQHAHFSASKPSSARCFRQHFEMFPLFRKLSPTRRATIGRCSILRNRRAQISGDSHRSISATNSSPRTYARHALIAPPRLTPSFPPRCRRSLRRGPLKSARAPPSTARSRNGRPAPVFLRVCAASTAPRRALCALQRAAVAAPRPRPGAPRGAHVRVRHRREKRCKRAERDRRRGRGRRGDRGAARPGDGGYAG